jgi:hypothetical protein
VLPLDDDVSLRLDVVNRCELFVVDDREDLQRLRAWRACAPCLCPSPARARRPSGAP